MQKRENLPDLIMVDGGKGQLGVALAVLKDLGDRRGGRDRPGQGAGRPRGRSVPYRPSPGITFTDSTGERCSAAEDGPDGVDLSGNAEGRAAIPFPPPAAVAGRKHPEKRRIASIFPGRKDPVYLSRWPAALFLLQRIRDEAHRFAVTYHRKVKEKEDLQSLLDRIPGIGPARRKALLVFFGDVRRVRSASVEDLQQVEGIGAETARRIRAFLDTGQE